MSIPTNPLAILAGPPGVLRGAIEDQLTNAGFEIRTLAGGPRHQMKQEADLFTREFGAPALLVTLPDSHDAAPFGELSRERWERLLREHLGLTVDASAAVVPHMVSAGRGTVVTTVSWVALAGLAGESYMAAASGSIIAFTKSFALEVAKQGVRVNAIAVGRLGQQVHPIDVAKTILFLQRDGDFFVGQLLRATAGAV